MFITIHQVYELWFEQILWELDRAVLLLGADDRASGFQSAQFRERPEYLRSTLREAFGPLWAIRDRF